MKRSINFLKILSFSLICCFGLNSFVFSMEDSPGTPGRATPAKRGRNEEVMPMQGRARRYLPGQTGLTPGMGGLDFDMSLLPTATATTSTTTATTTVTTPSNPGGSSCRNPVTPTHVFDSPSAITPMIPLSVNLGGLCRTICKLFDKSFFPREERFLETIREAVRSKDFDELGYDDEHDRGELLGTLKLAYKENGGRLIDAPVHIISESLLPCVAIPIEDNEGNVNRPFGVNVNTTFNDIKESLKLILDSGQKGINCKIYQRYFVFMETVLDTIHPDQKELMLDYILSKCCFFIRNPINEVTSLYIIDSPFKKDLLKLIRTHIDSIRRKKILVVNLEHILKPIFGRGGVNGGHYLPETRHPHVYQAVIDKKCNKTITLNFDEGLLARLGYGSSLGLWRYSNGATGKKRQSGCKLSTMYPEEFSEKHILKAILLIYLQHLRGETFSKKQLLDPNNPTSKVLTETVVGNINGFHMTIVIHPDEDGFLTVNTAYPSIIYDYDLRKSAEENFRGFSCFIDFFIKWLDLIKVTQKAEVIDYNKILPEITVYSSRDNTKSLKMAYLCGISFRLLNGNAMGDVDINQNIRSFVSFVQLVPSMGPFSEFPLGNASIYSPARQRGTECKKKIDRNPFRELNLEMASQTMASQTAENGGVLDCDDGLDEGSFPELKENKDNEDPEGKDSQNQELE